MAFSIMKRAVLPMATVGNLDMLAEAELIARDDYAQGRVAYSAVRRARARYRSAMRRAFGVDYPAHTYTGSGIGIVKDHTECYAGYVID